MHQAMTTALTYLELFYFATCGFLLGALLGVAIRALTDRRDMDD